MSISVIIVISRVAETYAPGFGQAPREWYVGKRRVFNPTLDTISGCRPTRVHLQWAWVKYSKCSIKQTYTAHGPHILDWSCLPVTRYTLTSSLSVSVAVFKKDFIYPSIYIWSIPQRLRLLCVRIGECPGPAIILTHCKCKKEVTL